MFGQNKPILRWRAGMENKEFHARNPQDSPASLKAMKGPKTTAQIAQMFGGWKSWRWLAWLTHSPASQRCGYRWPHCPRPIGAGSRSSCSTGGS